MMITNQGQVRAMPLPQGWQQGRCEELRHSLIDFNPMENRSVRLCFFYRGHDLSASSAQTFRRLLREPLHHLDGTDLEPLAELLADQGKCERFHLTSARTVILNGKRVLIVEGRYKQFNQDCYSVYIDADGSGFAVQEIYFVATPNQFARYFPAFRSALDAVEWQSTEPRTISWLR